MKQRNAQISGELGARTNQNQWIYSASYEHKSMVVGIRNFHSQPVPGMSQLEIRPYVGRTFQFTTGNVSWNTLARVEWRSGVDAADRVRFRYWIKSDELPFYAEVMASTPSWGGASAHPDGFFRLRLGAIFSWLLDSGGPPKSESPTDRWRLEAIPLVELGGGALPNLWTIRMRVRYHA